MVTISEFDCLFFFLKQPAKLCRRLLSAQLTGAPRLPAVLPEANGMSSGARGLQSVLPNSTIFKTHLSTLYNASVPSPRNASSPYLKRVF